MPIATPSPASAVQTKWLIGKADDCDIVLTTDTVSSHHCRLTRTATGFALEDNDSTNGTYVDGIKLTAFQAVPVTQQNTITLGRNVPFPWDQVPALRTGTKRVVTGSSITVGRTPGNDVVIDYPIVSSSHARIEMRDGQFYIEDANSRNGTSINSLENRISGPSLLRPNDQVFLGSYKIPASKLLEQFAKPAATAIGNANYEPITLKGDSMVIGRDPECDQTLNFPMISWRHARVTRNAGGTYVEDLGSSNGTFINGKRISGVTRLEPGQEIGLGSFRFQLLQGGELAKRRDLGYTIEARDVMVTAPKGKVILEPVSFTVFAGEMVALMGTSGAGKTTLLKALNGYAPPKSGTVFYNGSNLYSHYDEYSQKIGYVPQDDIVHDKLTVSQALSYAARLRTPLSELEITSEVKRIAADLKLTDLLGEVIGSPENKTLSGGQRKRVNIALELICDTPVLFLDEPTSGLSSADADSVVKLLKSLARDGGKTIVTTIHAPSLDAYRSFDNLIMLARDSKQAGKMAFFGPAYPDSIQFVTNKGTAAAAAVNPGLGPEILMSTLQQDEKKPDPSNTAEIWSQRYKTSKYFTQFVVDRAGRNPAGNVKNSTSHGRGGIDLKQWLVLAARSVWVRGRDKQQLYILGAQAPVFALLIAGVFGRIPESATPANYVDLVSNLTGIHFLMVVAAVWFGCNNAVRDVVGEWLIYQRERMVCLRLPSYIVSKLCLLSVIGFIQCLLMLGIVYPVCNLSSGFVPTLGVLWLTSMVGAAIGLLISSAPFCKTTESAIALLPIVLLPMIGLGGGIKAIYKLPVPAAITSNLIPTRWAFEADLVKDAENRHDDLSFLKPQNSPPASQPSGKGVRSKNAPASLPANAKGGTPSDAPVGSGADPSKREYPAEDVADQAIPKTIVDATEGKEEKLRAKYDTANKNRHSMMQCVIVLAGMFVVLIAGVLASLKSRDVH